MTDSQKLDCILSEVYGLKEEVQGMKEGLQETKEEVQGMKEGLQETKEEVQGMKVELQNTQEELQNTQEKVQGIQSSIQELSEKVTAIELTIENEIRDNIRCIAEGHLDLSRNLHEAMKPYEEIEIHSVKINMLETDVRELKERIS